jgi:hypothetical protein
MFKEYLEVAGERYQMVPPSISVHNLIFGTPYLDIGGKAYIRNIACPNEQYAEIDFFKRGWSEDTYHRVTA